MIFETPSTHFSHPRALHACARSRSLQLHDRLTRRGRALEPVTRHHTGRLSQGDERRRRDFTGIQGKKLLELDRARASIVLHHTNTGGAVEWRSDRTGVRIDSLNESMAGQA